MQYRSKVRKEDLNFREGYVLYKNRRYQEAIPYFKKSIEEQAIDFTRSVFFIGKIYLIQKKYKEAEEQLKKYIEIDRDRNPHARLELGKLYAGQGKETEAEEQFKKYIEIDKDRSPHARLELAKLELEKLYTSQGKEIEKEEISEEDRQKIDEIFYNQLQTETLQGDVLTRIRAQIYIGTIESANVEEIKARMQGLDRKQYYLIQIAIYEKLKQKSNALNVIKQMEEKEIEVKGLGEIKQRLKSKKTTLFDLGKWDDIIGWSTVKTQAYEEEREKLEKEEVEQEPKKKKQEKQVEGVLETEKEKSLSKEKQKPNYIRTNIDSVKSNIEEIDSRKKRKIGKKKIKEKEEKTETISSKMSETLKTTIEKINCHYYVNMQPQEVKRENEEEYQQLLQEIKEANVQDKKRLMGLMRQLLQGDYEEKARQEKYMKKYDKLQSLLECSKDNKRAQMELMLVLINEGYREVVKREFPKEDYEVIDETIKQYYAKTITPKVAKQKIDDYVKTTKQEGISIE